MLTQLTRHSDRQYSMSIEPHNIDCSLPSMITRLDFKIFTADLADQFMSRISATSSIKCLSLYDSNIGIVRIPACISTIEYYECVYNGQINTLAEKLIESPAVIKRLVLSGRLFTDNSEMFCEYLKRCQIEELDLIGVVDDSSYYTHDHLEKYLKILSTNTNLKTLRLPKFGFPNYDRPLMLTKLENLSISNRSLAYNTAEHLATFTSLSSLTVLHLTDLGPYDLNMLVKNSSIRELNFEGVLPSVFYVGIPPYERFAYLWVNHWLDRNKSMQWKHVSGVVTNITIAMFRLDLPPYVLLEIIDWICPDNPYSTHYKKIMLVLRLYARMRAIVRSAIADSIAMPLS